MKKILSSLIAVVAIISFTACTSDGEENDYLLNDPMVTESLDGFQDGSETLLITSSAEKDNEAMIVTRCVGYSQTDEFSKEAMESIVEIGKSYGWKHSDDGKLDTDSSMISFKENDDSEKMVMIVSTNGVECGGDKIQVTLAYP